MVVAPDGQVRPDVVAQLCQVPWLSRLTGDVLRHLAQGTTVCRTRRGGEVLRWQEDTAMPGILILLSGQLRVERPAGAQGRVLMRWLTEFDVYGEDGLVLGEPSRDCLVSVRAVEAVHIDALTISRCLARSADLRLALICQITRKVRRANARIRTLALETVNMRLWRVLHELSGLNPEEPAVVKLRHRITELAAATAASRNAVGRALRTFEARQMIRQEGPHRIVLLQALDAVSP